MVSELKDTRSLGRKWKLFLVRSVETEFKKLMVCISQHGQSRMKRVVERHQTVESKNNVRVSKHEKDEVSLVNSWMSALFCAGSLENWGKAGTNGWMVK